MTIAEHKVYHHQLLIITCFESQFVFAACLFASLAFRKMGNILTCISFHVGLVATEIFIQIAIYNNPQFTTAVCIIHLPACPNAFPLFLKRNRIMGGLGQDSSIFFSCFLTNGNILILAFIPQDWKYNFMITSLLEPCLIIPNYAARHLVHSVSRTMLPEQQLARCSVCVQSPWYHRWACSPILAGYNAGTYAVVLIIQHGIVQEGVYSVSLAPAFFLQFVTQFTQTWSMERFRPCMWRIYRHTGTPCTYCVRKTHSLQKQWRLWKCLYLQVSNDKEYVTVFIWSF